MGQRTDQGRHLDLRAPPGDGVPRRALAHRHRSIASRRQCPKGSTPTRRAGLIKEVTDAVARAEGVSAKDAGGTRLGVPDGNLRRWHGQPKGVVRRLPDIMEYFGGPAFRELGEKRLAAKRRRDTIAILEAALQCARGESRADTCSLETERRGGGLRRASIQRVAPVERTRLSPILVPAESRHVTAAGSRSRRSARTRDGARLDGARRADDPRSAAAARSGDAGLARA